MDSSEKHLELLGSCMGSSEQQLMAVVSSVPWPGTGFPRSQATSLFHVPAPLSHMPKQTTSRWIFVSGSALGGTQASIESIKKWLAFINVTANNLYFTHLAYSSGKLVTYQIFLGPPRNPHSIPHRHTSIWYFCHSSCLLSITSLCYSSLLWPASAQTVSTWLPTTPLLSFPRHP